MLLPEQDQPVYSIIPAKEESPQDQEKKKNLRVAAYCRVSTKKDEQLGSYENQKAYYTEKIMANPNWTMADIFADEGITGTSACKRKDFLRMIRQCRKGKIDMILAKSVSRFARNTVDTLSYTRELRSMGIPVIFEEQNINSIYPESEFLITIHGAFAQSESEGIVKVGRSFGPALSQAIRHEEQLLEIRPVDPDGKQALAVIDAVGDQPVDLYHVMAEFCAGFFDKVDAVIRKLLEAGGRNELRHGEQPPVFHVDRIIDSFIIALNSGSDDAEIADDPGVFILFQLIVQLQLRRLMFIFKNAQRNTNQIGNF